MHPAGSRKVPSFVWCRVSVLWNSGEERWSLNFLEEVMKAKQKTTWWRAAFCTLTFDSLRDAAP